MRALWIGGLALLLAAPLAMAKVSEEEAARLERELNVRGAEVAGNADGSIPAWTGKWLGLPPGLTWKGPGQEAYPDPYAADKPLFSIDAFAGGLVVQSLLALWLFQRFGLSLTSAGAFFFWAGMLTATSQLAAPWVARRIGLLNTMVFTHIPSSVALIAAAFATQVEVALGLLLLRAALSQMDVPTRSAFVMAAVTPPERAAAASYTSVPRSLASALSPSLGGALFAAGWMAAPLVMCGALKIMYDLALLAAFRKVNTGS